MKKFPNFFKYLIFLLLIPAAVLSGALLFDSKKYIFIAICVAILACLPFFSAFESKKISSRKLTVLAVMVTLSVIGRALFSFIPHFKPVTAIVVITGIYLGAESGFLCGALSALLSNFIFGQGPWTPFQMFAWGLIGLFSALLSKPLQKSKVFLCIFSAISGIMYSLLLDISSTLWYDGAFNLSRYTALVLTSLPVMAVYAVSNAVFLLFLAKPMGEKLIRIKIKYGI
ncbi:MAG: ECF transporter S component [Clostridia bacterium]|nr:ECF transporter S component [Clostridia bacterium]